VDDGFVVAGGPVGDGEETLHLVEAANETEVHDQRGAGRKRPLQRRPPLSIVNGTIDAPRSRSTLTGAKR
jgi:hypothetical protein